MLVIFFFSVCFSHFRCIHDEIQQQFGDPPSNVNVTYPVLLDSSSRRPIRVFFDMFGITEKKDGLMCNKVGQSISWLFRTHKCRDVDVVDDLKIRNLNRTMENIRLYITKLLNVTNEVNPIQLEKVSDIPACGKPIETDLYIAVACRAFNPDDKILGSAFSYRYSTIDGRPNVGGIYINPAYIPEIPQDEHSIDHTFFHVIFHELCHVLGISSSNFNSWIDKRSGTRYQYPIVTYQNDFYKKRFRILITPAARRFAQKRFNVTEFAPGIPAGIEIEDGGGSGTAGSHPESRVYISEVMCGIFVGYTYISELVLSMLDDSGWYDVNYELADPYPWGDGSSMLMPPMKTFLNGPPQLAFPHHYLCWHKDTEHLCSYDFKAKASCSPVTDFNCNSVGYDDKKSCEMKYFVNPLNLSIRGDRSEFDFLYFNVPDEERRCDDESLFSYEDSTVEEEFGSESMCAMSSLTSTNETETSSLYPRCYKMRCDINQVLYITVVNETKICHHENQTLSFDGFKGYVLCPNPQYLCGIKQFFGEPIYENDSFYEKDKFSYTLFPNTPESTFTFSVETDIPNESNGKPSKQVLIILGSLLILCLLFLLITFLLIIIMKINYNRRIIRELVQSEAENRTVLKINTSDDDL